MKSSTISPDRITVLPFVERPLSKVADDRDARSIKEHGVQQPLVLVPDGDRLLLAKGLRRLRIAKALRHKKVPYVTAPPPKGMDAAAYVRELRLALDMHRQDLLPSQKCALVEELKKRFGMMNKEIAVYLGVDQDTITNWLAVRRYISEIVQALDSELLAMTTARVFDGMSEKGQMHVWKRHGDELIGPGNSKAHKRMRALYPPSKHADFYRNAKVVTDRLMRKSAKRKGKPAAISSAEKRRLSSSVELKEIELREGADEERRLKAQIHASIAPLAAIMRSEKLLALVPEEMREELDRFAEIYV